MRVFKECQKCTTVSDKINTMTINKILFHHTFVESNNFPPYALSKIVIFCLRYKKIATFCLRYNEK